MSATKLQKNDELDAKTKECKLLVQELAKLIVRNI